MARRENQGLQIAVILLVLFSVIMSGLTYMFWSGKQKAVQAATAANEAKTAAETSFSAMSLDNQNLKKMLGAAPDAAMTEIDQAFARDMELFAATVAEEKRNYPFLPTFLMGEIRQRDDNLKEERDRVAKLKADMDALTATTAAELAKVNEARTEAANKLLEATNELAKVRDDSNQANATLTQEFEAEREKTQQELTKLQAENTKLTKETERLRFEVQRLKKEIAQLVNQTMDHPDGEVTWVNQQSKFAYINLGSADGLQRLTQFKVYGGDVENLADAKPKGSIEVTRILGPHRSEALITDDEHTNPIVRGDLIFTPIWEAGNPMRFALAGFMDLDKDGVSDRELVKNIIALNGGVVDAEVTDEGKREGELSIQTTYLVLGKPPTDKTPELVAEFTRVTNEAKDLGVKEITVDRLLSDMNYRGSGTKAKPNYSSSRSREVTREQGDITSRFRREAPAERPRVSAPASTD